VGGQQIFHPTAQVRASLALGVQKRPASFQFIEFEGLVEEVLGFRWIHHAGWQSVLTHHTPFGT
jgi:hypothetical protein